MGNKVYYREYSLKHWVEERFYFPYQTEVMSGRNVG